MTKKLGLFFAGLFAVLLLAAAAHTPRSTASNVRRPQEPKPAPAAPPRRLTPPEQRGKALYLRGEGASGKELSALVGELEVPASTVTCAGCHGARGEGKTEGGVTAGNLTWANLTKPNSHTHPTGRKHGPFTEASFARALTRGTDPDGNPLLVAMPRYALSPEETADLIAYLKRIDEDRDPGLTETTLKLGTLLPAKGALAETGAAMREILTAYFQDLNQRGGVYERRVELQFAETGDTPAATAANVRRLVEEGQVFALVGGVTAGSDKELAALARELEVPFVGPSTLVPQTTANRHVFYLHSGVAEQARALVNFHAQSKPGAQARIVILSANGELGETMAAAAEDQCKKAGCGSAQKITYERGKFDAAALVQTMKGADAVFFFGFGGDEEALIREADAAGWRPRIFLLGPLAGRNLLPGVPASFGGKVFVAFPAVPSDITPAGVAEFSALLEKQRVTPRQTVSMLAAYAAAKIFTEALKRAGRDLSREKLITSLEGLYDFETGMTPRITFGPNRRVGAAGAHVMLVDTEKREFVPAGGWVKAF